MSAPTTPALRRFVTADEIKGVLGYTQPASVIRQVKEHGLPAHRVNRRYLFDPDEVGAWVRDRSASATAPVDRLADVWVAEQVAKFSPDDLRRAGELLLSLSKAASSSNGAA